jgi:hypothetical protein
VLVTVHLLTFLGLAWRVPEHGLSDYWPMVLFALLNLYVTYPVVLGDADLPPVMRTVRYLAETGLPRGTRAPAA